MSRKLVKKSNKTCKKNYSYQDCWNYASSLGKDVNLLGIKNDVIALCDTIPEVFWQNFTNLALSVYYYQKFCQRLYKYLCQNYPTPYLTQRVHFRQLILAVQEGVFIPQADTEILVQKVLEISEKYWANKQQIRVLDIGTGCGNIALSLAKSRPAWEIIATDINPRALKIAQKNSKYYQINNVKFILSDLFTNLTSHKKFDLIVSNPPYIDPIEYQQLSPFVQKQPREALLASEAGLAFYRQIIQKVIHFLSRRSLLIMEISPALKDKLVKLLISWWPNVQIEIFPDYRGQDRVLVIYLNVYK